MSNLLKREAFLKLLAPPWWDSKRHFSGSYYSQVKHCKVEFTVLSQEELLKMLSFAFYPDQDDINIIFDSSISDLAKKLEKALKKQSFQVDLIEEDQLMREGMQSIVAPINIPMHKAFYSESKELEKAGLHSLHELALLSPEVIAQTTGFSLGKAKKLNSVAMFLQIGMPVEVAEYTYQIAEIDCLYDFLEYDSEALLHQLSDFVPSLTLEMIDEWKLKARSVGVCILLKTILNYSTDEIVIILQRLGIQAVTARFHLLIKSFNHPSLDAFRKLLEQFFGEGFFEDRFIIINILLTLLFTYAIKV